MKLLTNKNQKELLMLIMENQTIINNYNQLEGFEQIAAYSRYCSNIADILVLTCGVKEANQFYCNK